MILKETQDQRDKELSDIIGVDIKIIKSKKIASPESIRVFDGDKIPTNEEEIENLYKEYKSLDIVGYLRTLMYTSVNRRHVELFQLLKNTKDKVCLDFGSGVGTHGIVLAENNNSVHILDVPGPLLEFAKKRFKNRNYKFTAYSNKSELPKNTFDVVVCSDVLEHVYDPIKELERIYESMKINGQIHVLVSKMKKNSSGHFSESIDKWLRTGPLFLEEHFNRIGETIYVKLN